VVPPANRSTRHRWTDTAIEDKLRAQRAALGHFPTRAERVARGSRSLWDAVRAADGVDAWRQCVDSAPSAPSQSRSPRARTSSTSKALPATRTRTGSPPNAS
jgi:hypothetical protein